MSPPTREDTGRNPESREKTGTMKRPDITLLAIDTAGAACSAALWKDGGVLSRRRAEMARGQAECLIPMVQDVLAEADVSFSALSAVAVTLGPGAFTGVRIGLAAAKGLAIALKAPLIGVTCFEAVAAAVPDSSRDGRVLAVALESKRSDLYLQTFAAGVMPKDPPAAIELDRLRDELSFAPILLAGDAKERAFAVLGEDSGVAVYDGDDAVDATQVAALAVTRGPGSTAPLKPLYLRPPDVTLPRPALGQG